VKTLVVYDSKYGNTKMVAEAMGAALPDEVEVRHVEQVDVSGLGAYDLLIVGSPTHGAHPSENTRAFLQQIPAGSLQGVRVAAFDTRMTNRLILIFGVAAPKIAKALQGRGGTQVGAPAGFFVTGGEGPLKEGELERAGGWAQRIVERMQVQATA
jgi:flavodoxin